MFSLEDIQTKNLQFSMKDFPGFLCTKFPLVRELIINHILVVVAYLQVVFVRQLVFFELLFPFFSFFSS